MISFAFIDFSIVFFRLLKQAYITWVICETWNQVQKCVLSVCASTGPVLYIYHLTEILAAQKACAPVCVIPKGKGRRWAGSSSSSWVTSQLSGQ